MDRLGRNLRHLVNTVDELNTRGIELKALTGTGAAIDTTTPAERLSFGIFAALAEFERGTDLRTHQSRNGLRPRPQRLRPAKMTPAKVRLAMAYMGQRDTVVAALCKELGVTRQTLYRHAAPTGELRPAGMKIMSGTRQPGRPDLGEPRISPKPRAIDFEH